MAEVLNLDLLIDLVIIVIFMIGVARFRTPSGARFGNLLTALAFAAAVAFIFVRNDITDLPILIGGVLVGSVLGWLISEKITMTRIPALIAIQNGAGGGASALVSIVELMRGAGEQSDLGTIFGCLGLIIGGVALSGSILAALKLENRVNPRPVKLAGHNAILLVMLLVLAALSVSTLFVEGGLHIAAVASIAIISLILGVVFSIRIGGADMPVLISFLNTLSGLAGAMVGVSIANQMLVAAGAMVGSSGLILTWVMCRSMNRTLLGVLTGHSGTIKPAAGVKTPDEAFTDAVVAADACELPGDVAAAAIASGAVLETVDGTAAVPTPDLTPLQQAQLALTNAESVIIVPGYGMAQARAQVDVASLATKLEREGKTVRFAVHPVAGRMPGHMHVLLAEADVDYDKLFEMDQINDEFAATDVVIVVGASDVVNPAAITQPDTPISGMPILNVHEAKHVIVCNLDAKPGYSGVDNPLYDDPKAILMFGDAKDTVSQLNENDTCTFIPPTTADMAYEQEVGKPLGDPASEAYNILEAAESIIIVPGYGMAQARAQVDVAALATKLERKGKTVRFAVHPVAGRMPGHMHVLLAEADVDYDKLFEMDQINDDFSSTDAVIVVGASDVVNPAAITQPDTPISGMPILNVHLSKHVIVCNLDERPGYSGVDNPLYLDPKVVKVLGDAKETVDAISCRFDV